MKGHGIAAIVAGIVIGVSHIATAHEGGHEESVSGSTAFTAVTPILNVESVEASIAHYTSVLGFKKNWDWPAEEEDKTFASISNGEVTVFLSEKGQGARPVWIYYSVDNVDELHEKLARAGAEIRQKPVDRPWGAREMLVADRDGHILRIGGPSNGGHGESGEEHGEGKKEHAGSEEDDDREEGHH
ncbi:MAG: glyoxalase superfamily protein [Gemmatimonadota bacterium]|nr:glyoxalase superfamily protein [Gemmatimonadota bacterium]